MGWKKTPGTEEKKTIVSRNPRDAMFKRVCALIPGKVTNATVINAFEVMRKGRPGKKTFPENEKQNERNFSLHLPALDRHKGYIEDQNSWADVSYGKSTMQYSGCEIFATFNAIFSLTGRHVIPLHQMIAAFEKDGMVLAGKFGTAPKAIVDFLNRNGFRAVMTTEEGEFDRWGRLYDSLILTMYNDKHDISKEVHTVNISKEGDGFCAHNVYCNGTVVGPFPTVSEVIQHINGGKARGISLIGVKKK